MLQHREQGRRGESHEKKEVRPAVCQVTKRDEAGARIAMAMQFWEPVTRCLSMKAECIGWTAVGKDMLSWIKPMSCV